MHIRSAARVPVLGVIETGADSAAAASVTRDVLVLATDATVDSHAYAEACAALGVRASEKACPLLVPLIEEGWTGGDQKQDPASNVTRQVLRIYLDQAFTEAEARGCSVDTVLLGCTHYPLLHDMLKQELPRKIRILDSADTTARRVRRDLETNGMLSPAVGPDSAARCKFFATDSVGKFRALGSRFLGQPIDQVELIDLGG